jgi:hypothetical protein
MAETVPRRGLAFLGLLSFFFAFLGSRVFTTIYPDAVVVSGGIHFHHFWYGIVLVAVSGGLALAFRGDVLHRALAVAYGAGLGLIGDEVGLLLTFGDYHSMLTYEVVLGASAVVLMAVLLLVYRRELEEDFLGLGMGERMFHFGIFGAALGALFAAFGNLLGAAACLTVGVLLVLIGVLMRKGSSPPPGG